MKNLPEDELFNFVENRLRNYSELPDEEGWNKIAGAVASGSEFSKWTVWTNRTAATLSLLILFFLFYKEDVFTGNEASSNLTVEKKKNEPAQTASGPEAELPRTDVVERDNGTANTLTINSFFPSKEQQSHRGEVVNTPPMKSMIVDSQLVNGVKADAIVDSVAGMMGIEETTKLDNMVNEDKELRKDSAISIEHVIPPAWKRKKARLAFYSMISPSLSFQHVTPDSEDGVVVDKVNSPGVISKERFGFSIEGGIQGQISERFQYIVGLSFYHQSQEISYEESSEGSVMESGDDLNYEIKPATTTETFDYNMRNVGVQAGVLYTLKQRGLMHKAGVLLQYQIGLMKANEGDVYDNSSSDYFNYQLLYRVEYTFRSGIGLFVQPSYTRSILANESLDAPFKLKQSRASLGVGIVYRF